MVLIVAALLGAVGFAAGKYLIGGKLSGGGTDQGAPKVIVQDPDQEAQTTGDGQKPAPAEAQVKMAERAPTAAEKDEIEAGRPQDGAGLNDETGSAASPDSSVGADDKPLSDDEAKAPTAGKQGAYTVVAGSYADPANADREMVKLQGQGLSPYIVKIKRDGKTFHRVCVGSYGTQAEALKQRDKLREDGLEASVTKD
jgi:cell division protein FtsN